MTHFSLTFPVTAISNQPRSTTRQRIIDLGYIAGKHLEQVTLSPNGITE